MEGLKKDVSNVKFRIETKISGKTGNPYTRLIINFENGSTPYQFETMISNEQVFALGFFIENVG